MEKTHINIGEDDTLSHNEAETPVPDSPRARILAEHRRRIERDREQDYPGSPFLQE